MPAQQKWLIRQLSPTVFLDKMKRIYRPMSILVRREQDKYFWAENYGKLRYSKTSSGRRGSRFEVSCLEGLFFTSQKLTYKIVHTRKDVISFEEVQRKIRNT